MVLNAKLPTLNTHVVGYSAVRKGRGNIDKAT